EAARFRELAYGGRCRREAGDRSAAEVVAVREPAGENYRIEVGQLAFVVPDRNGLRVERRERPERVPVVLRAGIGDDADARLRATHRPPPRPPRPPGPRAAVRTSSPRAPWPPWRRRPRPRGR